MKYVYAVLGTILFMLALSLFASNKYEKEVVYAYPQIKSVVIQDERTYCDKISEMALISNWERICKTRGQDGRCSLSEKDAKQAELYKQFSLEQCYRNQ